MGAIMPKHLPRWSGYEVYVNDPSMVKDESELITWIMQPIE